MNREERERMVDGALARALAPRQVEPRDRFEERLLANLAAQPERRPWWRWVWVPALAAVVVIAIALGIHALRRPANVIETRGNTPPPEQPVETAKAPAQRPQVVRHKAVRRVQPHVQLAHANPAPIILPKQDVFPTPVPMTGQERLLLALVHRRPQQAKEIAEEQETYRQRVQTYFESGVPSGEPDTAQRMR
ncbi:MAG: hypothetical protein ACRD3E_14380 [Terriglobales bacterium]